MGTVKNFDLFFCSPAIFEGMEKKMQNKRTEPSKACLARGTRRQKQLGWYKNLPLSPKIDFFFVVGFEIPRIPSTFRLENSPFSGLRVLKIF